MTVLQRTNQTVCKRNQLAHASQLSSCHHNCDVDRWFAWSFVGWPDQAMLFLLMAEAPLLQSPNQPIPTECSAGSWKNSGPALMTIIGGVLAGSFGPVCLHDINNCPGSDHSTAALGTAKKIHSGPSQFPSRPPSLLFGTNRSGVYCRDRLHCKVTADSGTCHHELDSAETLFDCFSMHELLFSSLFVLCCICHCEAHGDDSN